MLPNIGVDTLVGSVPVLGDLFDVAWKSNQMNVALLERHLGEPVARRRASRLLVTGVVVVAIGLFVLAGIGVIALVRALIS